MGRSLTPVFNGSASMYSDVMSMITEHQFCVLVILARNIKHM